MEVWLAEKTYMAMDVVAIVGATALVSCMYCSSLQGGCGVRVSLGGEGGNAPLLTPPPSFKNKPYFAQLRCRASFGGSHQNHLMRKWGSLWRLYHKQVGGFAIIFYLE